MNQLTLSYPESVAAVGYRKSYQFNLTKISKKTLYCSVSPSVRKPIR